MTENNEELEVEQDVEGRMHEHDWVAAHCDYRSAICTNCFTSKEITTQEWRRLKGWDDKQKVKNG